MGDCGPSSFKGTVTWDRERSSKVAMGVKMSPKRGVHAVGGWGAQRKGPTIVKGLSHEILNGMK